MATNPPSAAPSLRPGSRSKRLRRPPEPARENAAGWWASCFVPLHVMLSDMKKMAYSLLLALPLAFAHHSFEAEYDFNKTIKATGIVTKMEWMNPHAHFYVDIKDESGKVV